MFVAEVLGYACEETVWNDETSLPHTDTIVVYDILLLALLYRQPHACWIAGWCAV
jgi:hypothetical protein